MTVLINTQAWVVEYDARHLWVTKRETAMTLPIAGTSLVKMVRDCLKTHTPDRVAETCSRLLGPNAEWVRLYKAMPAFEVANG
jgi:hypothetical protein